MSTPSSWISAIDLVTDPTGIQPTWWFDAVFLVGAVVVSTIGLLSWRYRWRRWSLVPFAILWTCGVLLGIGYDVRHAYAARAQVRAGNYTTLKGCLDAFHPGRGADSRFSGPVERWSIAGVPFDYAGGEAGFFYTTIESRGGVVHADSRVWVSFIHNPTYGKNEIVRLAVQPHACRAAPDQG